MVTLPLVPKRPLVDHKVAENSLSCNSGSGSKPQFIPPRQDGILLIFQPALRAWIHPGNHQLAFRRVDRGVRLGASHRSVAGPPHPPRPHPGDEWRELPTEAQPGEHRLPGLGRSGRLLSTSGPLIPAPEASPCRFPVWFFVTVLVEHFSLRRDGTQCRRP